jgi:hypothetical protein
MTIAEIQQLLKTSFKNGFYIRRPHFIEHGIELYIDKRNNVYQLTNGKVLKDDFMNIELEVQDWEII